MHQFIVGVLDRDRSSQTFNTAHQKAKSQKGKIMPDPNPRVVSRRGTPSRALLRDLSLPPHSRCPTSGPPGSATAPPTLSRAAWSWAAWACPTPRSTESSTAPVRPRSASPFFASSRRYATRAPRLRGGDARAVAFRGHGSLDARLPTRRRRAPRARARDRTPDDGSNATTPPMAAPMAAPVSCRVVVRERAWLPSQTPRF